MVGSVQSLTNMEFLLYGNTPNFGNLGAPSSMNGFRANSAYLNSYYANPYMNYGMFNPTFGQSINPYASNKGQNTQGNSIFTGLSKNEQEALVNDYTKSLAPSESLVGAATGAAAFSVLFHPRVIAHPIKTYNSSSMTKQLFEDVTKQGTKLAEGWAQPGTNKILRDAYTAMNRIDARSLKKDGLHILRKPLAEGEYDELVKIMKKALKDFDINNENSVKELLKATETLNTANVKDGFLARGFNWVRNLGRQIVGKEPIKITSALDAATGNAEAIEKAATDALNAAKAGKAGIAGGKTYLQTLKSSSGGALGAAIMMGMEFLGSKDKIKASFKKDSQTGWKQVGQTTVKGLGNAAGWAAGEALGTWGCAKLLAAAGTAISPGIGTAIGAVAGMIVGSIGCWVAGRITNKIVGQDVGDKVQAEQLAQSPEGQAQLLQNTYQRMQKGENVDPQAQMAVQKMMTQYTVAA